MRATKGYGCTEHPKWGSVMVPIWFGWWLPRIHLWAHNRLTNHTNGSTP